MAIVGKYINESDCQAELSAEVWQRICDDDASGAADEVPGQLLVDHAESFVEARIGAVYSLTVLRAQGRASVCHEIQRIVLQVLRAFALKRHPGYIRGDWVQLLDQSRIDLKELRTQLAQLDTTTAPEPAANAGGNVESGSVDEPDSVAATFLGPGGMGDFA